MNPRAAALTTLGGEVFSGEQAAAYGLVTAAVPADELEAEVRRTCESLATGAAQGLRESKRILNRDLVARIDERGEELAALSATPVRLRRGARGDDRVPVSPPGSGKSVRSSAGRVRLDGSALGRAGQELRRRLSRFE